MDIFSERIYGILERMIFDTDVMIVVVKLEMMVVALMQEMDEGNIIKWRSLMILLMILEVQRHD